MLPNILNIAHRGARSVAPENTIYAARKAIELAETMRASIPQTENWEIVSVALTPSRRKEKWYWLVKYEGPRAVNDMPGMPFSLSVVVLMDGTVVKPLVYQDAPRQG